jgi:hypothetical protein
LGEGVFERGVYGCVSGSIELVDFGCRERAIVDADVVETDRIKARRSKNRLLSRVCDIHTVIHTGIDSSKKYAVKIKKYSGIPINNGGDVSPSRIKKRGATNRKIRTAAGFGVDIYTQDLSITTKLEVIPFGSFSTLSK